MLHLNLNWFSISLNSVCCQMKCFPPHPSPISVFNSSNFPSSWSCLDLNDILGKLKKSAVISIIKRPGQFKTLISYFKRESFHSPCHCPDLQVEGLRGSGWRRSQVLPSLLCPPWSGSRGLGGETEKRFWITSRLLVFPDGCDLLLWANESKSWNSPQLLVTWAVFFRMWEYFT